MTFFLIKQWAPSQKYNNTNDLPNVLLFRSEKSVSSSVHFLLLILRLIMITITTASIVAKWNGSTTFIILKI